MGKISPEFPNSDFFMKSKQRFGVSLRFGVCQSAVRGLPSENSFSILAQSWPTLRPYGLYHARLPCPSLTPRACSNSCPLSWWCHPTMSSSPSPLFNLSQRQGLFQWVSSSHQVAKLLELQLQHCPFQWIFRTDFLRTDWLELIAVQETLKSCLQHHSSKASILHHSAFFIV